MPVEGGRGVVICRNCWKRTCPHLGIFGASFLGIMRSSLSRRRSSSQALWLPAVSRAPGCSASPDEPDADDQAALGDDELNAVNNKMGLRLVYDAPTTRVRATLKAKLQTGERLMLRVRRGRIAVEAMSSVDCSQLAYRHAARRRRRVSRARPSTSDPEMDPALLVNVYKQEWIDQNISAADDRAPVARRRGRNRRRVHRRGPRAYVPGSRPALRMRGTRAIRTRARRSSTFVRRASPSTNQGRLVSVWRRAAIRAAGAGGPAGAPARGAPARRPTSSCARGSRRRSARIRRAPHQGRGVGDGRLDAVGAGQHRGR